MRTLRLRLALWLALLACADAKLQPANTGDINEEALDHNDRVAMLMTDQMDPKSWCMGLLVAPDAVLTYASCVDKLHRPLAWAFFGDSYESFRDPPYSGVMEVPDSNSTSSSDDVEVGDDEQESVGLAADSQPWARLISVSIHPLFNGTRSAPTTDLAVVRLQKRRSTTPFSLANKMESNANESSITNTNATNYMDPFRGFRITNEFLFNPRSLKVQDFGHFSQVGWRYCMPPALSKTKLVAHLLNKELSGQACVVASVVEDRRNKRFSNTFMIVDGKLVGISTASESKSASHRIVLLSDASDFISMATRDTGTWMNVNFIVGGSVTPKLQGYVVGLRATKSAVNFCLGALIAPKFVLTAAHCVHKGDVDQVSVGSLYSSTEIDGEQIKVKTTIAHPDYNPDTYENDVAIVELEYISIQPPIVLFDGKASFIAPGKRLTMVGYAPTPETSSEDPASQHYVELPVVDKTKCKAVLQPPVLDASMLCAGGQKGKDACHGDSGGPLVVRTTVPEALVATASFGRGCGEQGMPAVYSVAANAASFIDKHVERHRWISAFEDYDVNEPTPAPTTKTPEPSSKPPSSYPGGDLPSSPPTSPVGGAEERSNEDSKTYTLRVLASIAKNEGWAEVPSISVEGLTPSFVIGVQYSSFTRAVLTTVLLSAENTTFATASLEELTRYAPAKAIELYSPSGLQSLVSLIKAFDSSPLRRRQVRFGPRISKDIETCSHR